MELAEEATEQFAQAQDKGPPESKPYDEKYYGALSDVQEFKQKHKVLTEKVLLKAGGKYSSLR